MKILDFLKCAIRGHILDTPSIINFIDRGNFLKKCSCCGRYVAKETHGLTITLSEKEALEWKKEFEETFPYLKLEGGFDEWVKRGGLND
jgi:hypothetical protein